MPTEHAKCLSFSNKADTMTQRTERTVADYIARHQLLTPHAKVLVALSGGADSVALLRLLVQLGYDCEAAHCNFGLRGAESDRDEDFVRHLCAVLRVPLHVTRFHTRREAADLHISLEMAARKLRYEWFETVRDECAASAIAVAHHRDDSAETFLLNLLRGTGIKGLTGIRPRNGHIVRPLLCIGRQDIVHYLEQLHQPYVTDSTNLKDEYLRNKIRLHLLPLMQTIAPAARENILKTAAHLADASLIYQHAMDEARAQVMRDDGRALHIPTLLQMPALATVLFECLHPLGFNESQVDDIFHSLQGQPGKRFAAQEWQVVKDRECLLLEPKDDAETVRPPRLEMRTVKLTPDFIIRPDRKTAYFDADKLTLPLSLRKVQTGDKFVPFGMKGQKKVSDYLTDRKMSVTQKERQWVLCSGDDIAWLVGERSDNRFRIGPKTQKVTIVTVADD